ncbi:MAG TPA: DHA2 family efflux MFS transporter permease subunit [Solirubrobacterales bacterium]|nr:DHA2 family efflux MFS transporter permease subunit [Solirubrobacterales bacterium]
MTGKWWTLVGACFGLFLLMLDSTVVSLALPAIRGDVGASAEQLQWMMNAYLLTIAVLAVTAGRLGDIFGRRRLFLIGMSAFGVGSVVSGLAGEPDVLILGRIIQGAGAAPVLTLSLALVCNVFPDAEVPKALGIWAAVSSSALAIGPLVGGALVELDWRVIFLANLPLVVVGMLIVARFAPESTDPGAARKLDWPGLATLSLGLTLVVLALVQADAWPGPLVIVLVLVGTASLATFWVVEHRVRAPIVEFALFRNGPYFGASAAAFCLVGAWWAVIYFQPQYLQDVRGHTPLVCGLEVLPITLPMVFVSPFSGRLIAKFGPRLLMTFGMAVGTAGMLVLTRVDATTSYAVLVLGYVLFGIALGLVYAPMSTAAMAAMPGDKVGIASGVLSMVRLLAGAVALAGTGAIFRALLGSGHSFAGSLAGSTWLPVGLMGLGAILAWGYVRGPAEAGPDPAVAGAPAPVSLHDHAHHRRFHL